MAGLVTELGDKSLMEFVENLFHKQDPEPEDWRGYIFDRRDLLSMAGAAGEVVPVGIT
jgi:hypothetical protein